MTEPTGTDKPETPAADETFTWTGDDEPGTAASGAGATAAAILESIREAVDDLAERASPSVREFSARAAEMAALAADRAAPMVKRAGDVTSEASDKIASRSRAWAADIRSTLPADTAGGTDDAPPSTTTAVVDPIAGSGRAPSADPAAGPDAAESTASESSSQG